MRGTLMRVVDAKTRLSTDAERVWEWDRTEREGLPRETHKAYSKLAVQLNPHTAAAFMALQYTEGELEGLQGAHFAAVDGLKGRSALPTQTHYPVRHVNPLHINEDATYSGALDRLTFSGAGGGGQRNSVVRDL